MTEPDRRSHGLRVAQVIATGSFAGTERYATNLAAGLARRGIESLLVGADAKSARAALDRLGASVHYVPAHNCYSAFRQLRDLRPLDLVHCHLTPAEFAGTAAFPSRKGTVVVATRHIAARRGSTPLSRMGCTWVRARLDSQMAISHFVASRVDGPS
ncbi:MAG TPA: glycosyltransferase family 4 protein, partial [Acidimicrobiales bacterium]|nr:glycosyltransferase family 4 protein [Acidimicrobiales bacterium]